MQYQIQGYGLQFPDGYTEEADTAAGAIEIYVRVLKLCGKATVYRRVGPNVLQPISQIELRNLADEERRRERDRLMGKH